MKIPITYNLRNLVARRWTTLLTVVGIGLVVFVFSAVLMLAHGFRKTQISTGEPDNVIILRKGATAEINSSISREQSNIIKTQPEAMLLEDGTPLVAREVVLVNNLPKRADNNPSNVVVRGVSKESLILRSKVKVIEGRTWRPGTSEIIAGRGIADKFKGCGLGESVKMAMRDWVVVGIFAADGTNFESEIWGDVELMTQAFRRPISSMTMKIRDPELFDAMQARMESDPRLTVDVKREVVFYDEQSRGLGLFIKILGLTVTIIFSLGAVTGAVITMYSAVSQRAKEIATLRALGFRRSNILFSFLIECLLISVAGGIIGVLLAAALQLLEVSTTNFTTFSEVVFGFDLSPEIVAGSLAFAVVMGIIGGFAPALRAARTKIATGLRAV